MVFSLTGSGLSVAGKAPDENLHRLVDFSGVKLPGDLAVGGDGALDGGSRLDVAVEDDAHQLLMFFLVKS